MWPSTPALTIRRANSREPWITPHRLMSMIRSQSASVVSRNAPPIPIPALLTTIDGTPCVALDHLRELLHRAPSPTSSLTACMCASPGASPSVSFADPRLMFAAITSAPSAASASAVARPMPLPAPVTTASRPPMPSRSPAIGRGGAHRSPARPRRARRALRRTAHLVGVRALDPVARADVAAPDAGRPLVRIVEQRRRLIAVAGRDDQLHRDLRRTIEPLARAGESTEVRPVQRDPASGRRSRSSAPDARAAARSP